MNRRILIVAACLGGLSIACVGCSDPYPLDNAAAAAHRGIDRTQDALGRAADRTADGIEHAGNGIDNAAHRTSDWLRDRTRRVNGDD